MNASTLPGLPTSTSLRDYRETKRWKAWMIVGRDGEYINTATNIGSGCDNDGMDNGDKPILRETETVEDKEEKTLPDDLWSVSGSGWSSDPISLSPSSSSPATSVSSRTLCKRRRQDDTVSYTSKTKKNTHDESAQSQCKTKRSKVCPSRKNFYK